MMAFDIGANNGQSIEVLLKKGYDYIISAEANQTGTTLFS